MYLTNLQFYGTGNLTKLAMRCRHAPGYFPNIFRIILQLQRATVIQKLSYFEKQWLAKKFFKVSQSSQKSTFVGVSFLKKPFNKKEALTQVFSSEFWEIFKKTFFGCFCILKISVPVTEFTSAVDQNRHLRNYCKILLLITSRNVSYKFSQLNTFSLQPLVNVCAFTLVT